MQVQNVNRFLNFFGGGTHRPKSAEAQSPHAAPPLRGMLRLSDTV